MMRNKRVALLLSVLVLASLGVYFGLSYHGQPKVPAAIRSQLAFPAFMAQNTSLLKVKDSTIEYKRVQDDSILAFTATVKEAADVNGADVVVSQQAYPEALIYDKLTANFTNQSEVGTSLGKLTVGKPRDGSVEQAAVLNTGTTLIFAKPSRPLTPASWRLLFNGMKPLR